MFLRNVRVQHIQAVHLLTLGFGVVGEIGSPVNFIVRSSYFFCMRKIGETPMSGIGFSHFLPASAEKFSNNVKKLVKISVYMR